MSKTIMLVHGAWVTTDCWTSFRDFFEAKGHRVVVPEWPYLDRPAEELRRSPDQRLAKMTIKGLVDHRPSRDQEASRLSIRQRNVRSTSRSKFGICGNSLSCRIASMSFKSFSWALANTLSQSEQRRAYDRYIVPTPGRLYFQEALGVGNAVDFANPKRPPLLLIAASEDRTSTSSMVKAMYRKYSRAPSRTDIHEFPNRDHWSIVEPGWEEVADKALKWAEVNAKPVGSHSKRFSENS